MDPPVPTWLPLSSRRLRLRRCWFEPLLLNDDEAPSGNEAPSEDEMSSKDEVPSKTAPASAFPFMKLPAEVQDRIYSYIVAQRSEHNPTWATLHETRKYPIMAVSHQIRCGFLSVFAQTHPVRRWFYFFLDLPRREGLPSAVAKCNVCDQWAVNLLRSTYVKRTTKFPSNPTPLPPPLSFVSTLKIKITQRRVGCPRETLARATIRFPRFRDSVPTFELKKVKKLGAKSSARFESFVSDFRGRLERWWKDEKRRRYSAAFARLLDPNSSETAAYMEMWKSGLWA